MPQEFKLTADQSFIGSWFLDDLTICDRLIDHFENSGKTHEGTIATSVGPVVCPGVKDSTDLMLDGNDSVTIEYANALQPILNEYINVYEYSAKTGPFVIQSAQIQKYNPGQGYPDWHCERSSANSRSVYRHLVFMTYLNDVFDEGETEWFYQKLKVKPRKGLTVIWPSDWTHTHHGIVSKTETKYIVTGWYVFVEENNIQNC